jgi:hypothetical protein
MGKAALFIEEIGIAVDGEVAHSNAGACMRRGSRSWLGEGGGKLE